MCDQHKWTKSEVNRQYHCCVDGACSKKLVVVMRKIYLRQTKEGFKKSASMIQNRKVLPRRNQDQVLPAALRNFVIVLYVVFVSEIHIRVKSLPKL